MNIQFEGLYKSYHDKMVLTKISGRIGKGSIEYVPDNALIIYLQQYSDFEPGAGVNKIMIEIRS